MAVVLSLIAAFSAGTSDFLGGLGSRRAAAVVVTAASQLIGVVVAVTTAAIIGGDPTARDLWLGALGGIGGGLGLLSIYVGYARARVAIAAPVAGVGAAALPVLYDVASGDEPSALTLTGILLGLVAIALVSIQPSSSRASTTTSLLYGLGGAVGLGVLLLALGQTSDDGGVWPVAPARLTGFLVMAAVLAVTRTRPELPRRLLPIVIGIGVLGTSANALYIGATQLGSVATAAVLTSLFPAVTVLWARLVFDERLRAAQIVGLVIALVAVAFIAVG